MLVLQGVCNGFLDSSFSEDESLVFYHGGYVEAVYRHQVHVGDLISSGCDLLRKLIFRVYKEDTGGPTSSARKTG